MKPLEQTVLAALDTAEWRTVKRIAGLCRITTTSASTRLRELRARGLAQSDHGPKINGAQSLLWRRS